MTNLIESIYGRYGQAIADAPVVVITPEESLAHFTPEQVAEMNSAVADFIAVHQECAANADQIYTFLTLIDQIPTARIRRARAGRWAGRVVALGRERDSERAASRMGLREPREQGRPRGSGRSSSIRSCRGCSRSIANQLENINKQLADALYGEGEAVVIGEAPLFETAVTEEGGLA